MSKIYSIEFKNLIDKKNDIYQSKNLEECTKELIFNLITKNIFNLGDYKKLLIFNNGKENAKKYQKLSHKKKIKSYTNFINDFIDYNNSDFQYELDCLCYEFAEKTYEKKWIVKYRFLDIDNNKSIIDKILTSDKRVYEDIKYTILSYITNNNLFEIFVYFLISEKYIDEIYYEKEFNSILLMYFSYIENLIYFMFINNTTKLDNISKLVSKYLDRIDCEKIYVKFNENEFINYYFIPYIENIENIENIIIAEFQLIKLKYNDIIENFDLKLTLIQLYNFVAPLLKINNKLIFRINNIKNNKLEILIEPLDDDIY